MIKKWFLDFTSSLILGLGFIFFISPLFLYTFIHGNHERYMWIISGPYPFDSFGSGPYQMFMYIALFILGLIFIAISLIVKRSINK